MKPGFRIILLCLVASLAFVRAQDDFAAAEVIGAPIEGTGPALVPDEVPIQVEAASLAPTEYIDAVAPLEDTPIEAEAAFLAPTEDVEVAAPLEVETQAPITSASFVQKINDRSKFPTARPKVYSFRTMSQVRSASLTTATNGVVTMRIGHLPLRGITSPMMAYFFSNIDKTAIDPQDCKEYPIYWLFHPIDHIQHTRIRTGADRTTRVGDTLVWIEFPLAKCTYTSVGTLTTPTNFNSGSNCLDTRTGFLQSDAPSFWAREPQGNSTMRVTSFTNGQTSGQVTFVFDVSSPIRISAAVTVTHAWQNTANGLRLDTTVLIGRTQSSSFFNTRIVAGYTNGEDRVPCLWRNVLHFIQEYGNLENIIPFIFDQRPGGPRATVANCPAK